MTTVSFLAYRKDSPFFVVTCRLSPQNSTKNPERADWVPRPVQPSYVSLWLRPVEEGAEP